MDARTYKASLTKEITTPNGLTCTVRKLGMVEMSEMGPIPGMSEMDVKDSMAQWVKYIEAALVSPKAGTGEDEIDVRTLPANDFNTLLAAAMGTDPTRPTQADEGSPGG